MTGRSTHEMVAEFHRHFARGEDPEAPVSSLPPDRIALRRDLIEEELEELIRAIISGNRADILKEITDLQYVLDGFYLVLGISEDLKMRAFEEVHGSNMTKLMPDGTVKRREDGKVLKGPNYRQADMAQFFQEA